MHSPSSASAKPLRFRPTLSLWPAEPRALPEIWHPERGHLAVPEDLVIREVIDTADFEEFRLEWGPITLEPGSDHRAGWFELRDASGETMTLPKSRDGWGDAEQRRLWRQLRALARQWLAGSDPDAVLDAWAVEGFVRPTSVEQAWMRWMDTLGDALRPYTMFPSLSLNGEPFYWGGSEPVERLGVYHVAALQLAQLATEGRHVLRCANEPCRRPFTRQRSTRRKVTNRGDYAGTAHAAGVRYCSAECGKAQQAREHRRRKRAEKEAGA